MDRWLLLQYKLPNKPSAPRVYIWRKLKQVGAVLILDALWVLPATARTMELFQWLAAEIVEMGGNVLLWQGQPAINGPEENLRQQFLAQVDDPYRRMLKQIQSGKPDLASLSREYQQTRSRDYFNSILGVEVRDRLISLRGDQK